MSLIIIYLYLGLFKGVFNDMIKNKKINSANYLDKNIRIIFKRLKILSIKTYKNVLNKEPEYSKEFETLINQPFLLDKQNSLYLEKSDEVSIRIADFNNTDELKFNEVFTDKCYSLLLKKQNNRPSCMTNKECFNFLLEPRSSGF
jgi:hypothetical protein